MNLNYFLQNRQYVVLFVVLIFIILFILILSFFLLRSAPLSPSSPLASPAPSFLTPAEDDPYSQEYKESVQKINEEEKSLLEQDSKVAAFINKLPELGINFTAAYDINTNSVTVTIPSDKVAEGNKEFDAYLQANGIKERSWIQNLTVKYQDFGTFEH